MTFAKKRTTALVGMHLVWTCPECGCTYKFAPAATAAKGTCAVCGGEFRFDCSELKPKLKKILESLP